MASSNQAFVEVTATFYQKGDETNARVDEHALWIKPAKDTIIENPLRPEEPVGSSDLAHIMAYETHGAHVLTDDNIGFDFSVMGTGGFCDDHYSCNLDIELEQVGHEEVFGNYIEDFAKIAKILKRPRSEDGDIVRFVVLMTVCYSQDYEGEWDVNDYLDGVLSGDQRLADAGYTLYRLSPEAKKGSNGKEA